MARLSLTFSITVLAFLATATAAAIHTTPATNPTTGFIRSSCLATTYPSICVQSLSTYASTFKRIDHKQLVITALSVSVYTAQSTKKFVYTLSKFQGLKPTEYAVIKDCIEVVDDNIDKLSKAVQELKSLGRSQGPKFIWHMSNVQTWVSAALTDANTCADGFEDLAVNGKIKSSIMARITNLAQVTSNALALSNQFAGNH